MTRNSKLAIAVLVLAGGAYAQNPPKQEPAPPAKPPMFVQNPDGTLTAQKEPPKDAKPPKGLVIPKQVVIPFVSPPQAPKH